MGHIPSGSLYRHTSNYTLNRYEIDFSSEHPLSMN